MDERISIHRRSFNKALLISKKIKIYGWSNFSFEELIKVPDEIADEMELLFQIQFNSYAPNGYNLLIGGQKFRHHSQDSKRKMSKNHADYNGNNNPNWGKHHSGETRKKISIKLKGLFAGEKHPLARLSYSEVCQIRNMYKSGKYTQSDLSKIFQIDHSHISRILKYQAWKGIKNDS
jgi:group I intron endonuclease